MRLPRHEVMLMCRIVINAIQDEDRQHDPVQCQEEALEEDQAEALDHCLAYACNHQSMAIVSSGWLCQLNEPPGLVSENVNTTGPSISASPPISIKAGPPFTHPQCPATLLVSVPIKVLQWSPNWIERIPYYSQAMEISQTQRLTSSPSDCKHWNAWKSKTSGLWKAQIPFVHFFQIKSTY